MRRATSVLFLALALAGCSSEGGVTGTGISSIVAGHVEVIDGGFEEGIEVSANGSRTITDEAGNFELFGEFSGVTLVRFFDPGSERAIGAVPISVPPGSTNILEGVVIDRNADETVELTVVRQASVVGRVQTIDCGPARSATIRLEDDSFFSFLLSDEVVIRDRSGAALGCRQLSPGDRIEVTGVQLSNGIRVAFAVEISERAPEPVEQFAVEFGGSVNDIFCEQGRAVVLVLTEDDPFLANIRARPGTDLICVDEGGPHRCDCEDIRERDIVQVRGQASVADPEAVVASSIFIFPGPAISEIEVRALRIGCNVRRIETEAMFENTSQVIIARFGDATRFVCNQRPCRCEDLRPDDRLRLVGSPIVSSGRPFVDVGLVQRLTPTANALPLTRPYELQTVLEVGAVQAHRLNAPPRP